MKKNRYIFFFVCASALFFVLPETFAATSANGVEVQTNVVGCNNNAICEPSLQENSQSCPIDCNGRSQSSSVGQSSSGYISSANAGVLEFENVTISIVNNRATISWTTTSNALTTFSWGQTADYEQGSISEIRYVKSHSASIENLAFSKRYYFKIEGKNAAGDTGIYASFFDIGTAPDTTPPSNVTRVTIKEVDARNLITWINPADTDFFNVRILRSTKAFPQDPLEGKIVYEGRANYTYDDVTEPDKTYYYTIYAFDKSGNVSSGALVSNTRTRASSAPSTNTNIPGNASPFTTLSLTDFIFHQNGTSLQPHENIVEIDGSQNLEISLNSEKLTAQPSLFTLELNTDVSLETFLFRDYTEKKLYQAVIHVKDESQQIPFSIYVRSATLSEIYVLRGTFSVRKSVSENTKIQVQFFSIFGLQGWCLLLFIIAILLAFFSLLFLLILWINKRRKRAILLRSNELNASPEKTISE